VVTQDAPVRAPVLGQTGGIRLVLLKTTIRSLKGLGFSRAAKSFVIPIVRSRACAVRTTRNLPVIFRVPSVVPTGPCPRCSNQDQRANLGHKTAQVWHLLRSN